MTTTLVACTGVVCSPTASTVAAAVIHNAFKVFMGDLLPPIQSASALPARPSARNSPCWRRAPRSATPCRPRTTPPCRSPTTSSGNYLLRLFAPPGTALVDAHLGAEELDSDFDPVTART